MEVKIYKYDDFEHHETMIESGESAWHKTSGLYDANRLPNLIAELTRNVKYVRSIKNGVPEGRVLVLWEYWLERRYTEIGDTAQDVVDFLEQYSKDNCNSLRSLDGELHLVSDGS
jgi:hypothetical protein